MSARNIFDEENANFKVIIGGLPSRNVQPLKSVRIDET